MPRKKADSPEELASPEESKDVLAVAAESISAEADKVQAVMDADDRSDPARYQALKDRHARLVDALRGLEA